MAISRFQIGLELKRILESEMFAGGKHQPAEKLARLLTHIVNGTLDEISLTQNALLIDFYGHAPDDLDGDLAEARVDANRLRKKLKEYNGNLGVNDPIFIDIPVGGYTAEFKENPLSPARKEITLGWHHVDAETPDHVRQANTHFDKAIEIDPLIADAWAGKASAYLTMTLHAYAEDPEDLFIDAERAAEKALALDKSCWRAHANLGAIYLFRHEWQKAEVAFGIAKQLAPLEITEIGGYGLYLLSCGYREKAREVAQDYIDVGFDDYVLLTRAGLYLYALRDFENAREVLLNACQRNPNFWRTHLCLAFVYLSLNEADKALKEMEEVEYCARVNLWPGMKILCLETTGKSERAEAEFAALLELQKHHYVQPMQLALGSLALGDNERAISFLGEACDEYDPFTAWLRLWAFLDPLRPFPTFRGLLRKWNFPSV